MNQSLFNVLNQRLIIVVSLLLSTPQVWSYDPILYIHPVRLAYGFASENDIAKKEILPQHNDFLWLKLGLEFPLHGKRSFLFVPRWYSRQFDLTAQEFWTKNLNKRRNQCEVEGKDLATCNKYQDVKNGTYTAHNHFEFELGLEWRWYSEQKLQGYFQKLVLLSGVGYYESDAYGLMDDRLRVKQDHSTAFIGAAMYGIGFETVGDFFAFTFDSAFGIQMAGPFPEYTDENQRPLSYDLFRAEFDFAFGFEL